MEFKLIPYMEIDGIRTFTDSDILGIYDRIIKEKKKYIFKDGTIYNRLIFLEVMKHTETLLYVVYCKKELLGIMWLNRFEGKIARVHWCTFNGFSLKKRIQAGCYVNQEVMNMKDKNGDYVFDLLIGYLPTINKAALHFIQMCGGELCGEIPNLIWNKEKNRSEPGVIGYYQRS